MISSLFYYLVVLPVILTFLHISMSSSKLGFLGNVLFYTIMRVIYAFITGSISSFFGFLTYFIIVFIFGIVLVWILKNVESYGDLKIFIVTGIISTIVIELILGSLLSVLGI